MTALTPRQEIGKPLAGGVFVLFWIIAIVLWSVAHLTPSAQWGAFTIDVGILFACVGFAAPFLQSRRGLQLAIIYALIGVLLFALGDFVGIVPLVYFLRILAPFMALLAPMFAFANNVRIFA